MMIIYSSFHAFYSTHTQTLTLTQKSETEQKCYTFVHNFVYSSFSHTINIVVCSTVPLFWMRKWRKTPTQALWKASSTNTKKYAEYSWNTFAFIVWDDGFSSCISDGKIPRIEMVMHISFVFGFHLEFIFFAFCCVFLFSWNFFSLFFC